MTLTPVERVAEELMRLGFGKLVGGECPDPLCGDNTWDHDCGIGPGILVPDMELAQAVVTVLDALRTTWPDCTAPVPPCGECRDGHA
jgi:hypothetical protein